VLESSRRRAVGVCGKGGREEAGLRILILLVKEERRSVKNATRFSKPGSKGEVSAWVLSTARCWWGEREGGREGEDE